MSVEVKDLNDIYEAICDLRDARNVINGKVYGTADPLFDRVKGYDITIKKAEEAYERLRLS